MPKRDLKYIFVVGGVMSGVGKGVASASIGKILQARGFNVTALKIGHIIGTNWPVSRLTAPKQATDLRVGACRRIGSLISGATHMRQREPCCWK